MAYILGLYTPLILTLDPNFQQEIQVGISFEVRRFLKVQSSSKEFVVQAGKGTGCKKHDPVQQALSNTQSLENTPFLSKWSLFRGTCQFSGCIKDISPPQKIKIWGFDTKDYCIDTFLLLRPHFKALEGENVGEPGWLTGHDSSLKLSFQSKR